MLNCRSINLPKKRSEFSGQKVPCSYEVSAIGELALLMYMHEFRPWGFVVLIMKNSGYPEARIYIYIYVIHICRWSYV